MHSSNLALLPFLFAFVMFLVKFYGHENAGSPTNPTFLLACLSVVLTLSFLVLRVLDITIPYGALAFGMVGITLAIVSVVRFMRI